MGKSHDIILWEQVPELLTWTGSNVEEKIRTVRETKKERIETAFQRGVETDFSGTDRQLFDAMWLDQNLELLNQQLYEDVKYEKIQLLEEEKNKSIKLKYPHYDLFRSLRLITLYYSFGSKGVHWPNRLESATEKGILEVLWERTKYKNDIAVANKNTWWVTGSENHDLNTKVCNLITSRIFASEPEFSERIYPNLGYGDGIGYGEANFAEREEAKRLYAGRADWSDGKEYTAEQHYQAWVEYFKEYFRERVRKGFFLENASPVYMKYTISYILGLYNFCGDELLQKMIKNFLDLFWADWAVLQIKGVRGGPKTRHHYDVGGYDSMTELARFYAGGDGKSTFNYVQQLISEYDWPEIVWEILLERKDKAFEYISRGVGEENTALPRPKGLERTLRGDVESRFVKYNWVTPDYILGTQMDHPHAVFNHLAIAGRWQGLTTGTPDARITTVSLDVHPSANKDAKEYSLEHVFHSVQHKDVLITQQRRRWTQINPDWFPAYDSRYYERPFGIYVGSGWDKIVEKGGWIFTKKDNTFAAIRILQLESDPDPLAWAKGTDMYQNKIVLKEHSYSWNKNRTIARLNNKFSPVIIEAGSIHVHQTLDRFIEEILSNPIKFYKTVATGETGFIFVYKGIGNDAKEMVYNAANTDDLPTIGGEFIEYSHSKVFDCPYIQSEYNSGVIKLKSSHNERIHDFNY